MVGSICKVREEECMGLEVLLLASFGDVKSKRILLGPLHTVSDRCTVVVTSGPDCILEQGSYIRCQVDEGFEVRVTNRPGYGWEGVVCASYSHNAVHLNLLRVPHSAINRENLLVYLGSVSVCIIARTLIQSTTVSDISPRMFIDGNARRNTCSPDSSPAPPAWSGLARSPSQASKGRSCLPSCCR